MRFKKSLKNAAAAFTQILFRTIANFVLTKFILMTYGSAINGIDVSIMNTLNYLNLLQAGASAAAHYHLVKAFAADNRQEVCKIVAEIDRIFKRIGWYMIVAVILFAAIYPLTVAGFTDKWLIVQLIIINGFVIISSYFSTGKFATVMQANQKVYLVTLADLLELTVGKCLAIVLVIYGSPFLLVKACVILGTVLRIGLLYILKNRHFPWLYYQGIFLEKTHSMEIRKDSKNVFVQQLTSMAFATTDMLIISVFCGVTYASVYAVYNMIVIGLNQIMNILIEAPYASFGNVLVSEKVSVSRRIFVDYEHITIIASTVLTASFIFLVSPFITLYTQGVTDISYDHYSLAILMGILFLLRNYRTLSAGALNVTGNFQIAKKFYLIEMIMNFVLSFGLVLVLGMPGVVLASIIAVFSSGIMMIRYVNKNILEQSPLPFLKKAGCNVTILMSIAVISKMIQINLSGYGQFILLGALTFITIGMIVAAINLIIWQDTFNAVKKYVALLLTKQI